MREIKFRIYRKKTKEMIGVDKLDIKKKQAYYEICDIPYLSGIENFEDIELMQYTGLKDKNGSDIYESDILKDNKGRISKVVWHGSFAGFVYKYAGEKNNVYSDPNNLHLCYMKMEVIGNVYENKDLLEVKKWKIKKY